MKYLYDLFGLNNRTAVVTGAARGNGEAISIALANAGADLIVCDILEEELQLLTQKLEMIGSNVISHTLDLSDSNQMQEFVGNMLNATSPIKILVNNAGVTFGHEVLSYPSEYWDQTYEVNLKAPFELSRHVAKFMKENGGGSIVNVTSLSAEQAFPDNVAYVTFKGALKQLTKALALDLAKFNIRVNNLGPGYIRTNMTQASWDDQDKQQNRQDATMVDRWGEPEDLAGAVIFLASDASSYMTAQDLYIDGGWLSKGL